MHSASPFLRISVPPREPCIPRPVLVIFDPMRIGLGLAVLFCAGALWAAEPSAREGFDDFLVEFMENPEFQKSRVEFPLPSISVQMDSEHMDTTKIDRKAWKFNEFKLLRAGTQVRQYDNFDRKLRDTDERVVSLIGNDNGVFYSYFFKRVDGRWYLVRIIDEST